MSGRDTLAGTSSGRAGTTILLAAVLLAPGVAGCGGSGNDFTTGNGAAGAPQGSGSEAQVKSLPRQNGERIPVKQGVVQGYVDSGGVSGKQLVLNGWAASADLSGPAQRIVAIIEGKQVADTKPDQTRPDVVEYNNAPSLKRSGFRLGVPVSALDCDESQGGVTVFGVVGKVAGPLTWVADSDQLIDEAC